MLIFQKPISELPILLKQKIFCISLSPLLSTPQCRNNRAIVEWTIELLLNVQWLVQVVTVSQGCLFFQIVFTELFVFAQRRQTLPPVKHVATR